MAGVPSGDTLQFQYGNGVLGNESIGFISPVPNSTAPTVLANGSTATTQTTGDSSTLVATDAFVQNSLGGVSGYTLNYATLGGNGGNSVTPALNNTNLFAFVLKGTLTFTKMSYNVTVADSTAHTYGVGFYNAAGTLICSVSVPGTTFAPATGIQVLTFSSCTLTGGQRYYIALTSGTVATATIVAGPDGFIPVVTNAAGVTSGGALNSTITVPADNWVIPATGSDTPTVSLHN
jgi:hypothetical protein